MDFLITSVDNTGIEAVFAGYDDGRTPLGSIVGRPASFVDKAVGKVSRIYQDPSGPYVMHVAVDDIPTLRLAATGCLTCVKVNGASIELADRREDFGKSFQLTTPNGERLAKAFRPMSDFEKDQALLAKHVAKLPAPLRKNEELALMLRGTEFEPRSFRKVGGSDRERRGANWPGSGVARAGRTQFPNANER